MSIAHSVCLSRSACIGVFVSVCPSRSVSLCLGRAGHTDEHTHDANNCAPAMSIKLSTAAGIAGIANVWSEAAPSLINLQKALQSAALKELEMDPPS